MSNGRVDVLSQLDVPMQDRRDPADHHKLNAGFCKRSQQQLWFKMDAREIHRLDHRRARPRRRSTRAACASRSAGGTIMFSRMSIRSSGSIAAVASVVATRSV